MRFNNDGTLTNENTGTGLVWLDSPMSISPTDWESAKVLCSQIQEGAYNLTDGSQPGDWRLPTVKEFVAILDYSRHAPPLPDSLKGFLVMCGTHWTCDRLSHIQNRVWCVELYNGQVFHEHVGEIHRSNIRTPIYFEKYLSFTPNGFTKQVAFIWPVRPAQIL